jgi:hypothetical protein
MWLPPSYRRRRSPRYWAIAIALTAVATVATILAAVFADKPYERVLTTGLALACVFSVLAYREQYRGGGGPSR